QNLPSSIGACHLVQPGDTCAAIAAANDITFIQLISYNPSINPACTNLISNTSICIGPSGAKYIVVPGDTCSFKLLSTEFGITLTFAQLQSWNPEINSQCSNLLVGDAYCVSAPSTPVSTSATLSPSGPSHLH
ncbi:hypothetical protein JOM56_012227, partial [Amanita muscaria]